MQLQKGDLIICHDIDDMLEVSTELAKSGIWTDFVVDTEKGIYKLEVESTEERDDN